MADLSWSVASERAMLQAAGLSCQRRTRAADLSWAVGSARAMLRIRGGQPEHQQGQCQQTKCGFEG
jgi:hypothetical protein